MSFAFVSWRVLLFWLNNWGDKSDSSWRDWTFINRISLLFWPWKIKQHVSDGCCRRNILMTSPRTLWSIWRYILHPCVNASGVTPPISQICHQNLEIVTNIIVTRTHHESWLHNGTKANQNTDQINEITVLCQKLNKKTKNLFYKLNKKQSVQIPWICWD